MVVHNEINRLDRSTSWTQSGAVAANQAAPTLATDGFAVGGKLRLRCGVNAITGFTDHSLWVYVYDNATTGWLVWAQFDGMGANNWVREVDVIDWSRAALRFHNSVGAGSVKTIYRLG